MFLAFFGVKTCGPKGQRNELERMLDDLARVRLQRGINAYEVMSVALCIAGILDMHPIVGLRYRWWLQ